MGNWLWSDQIGTDVTGLLQIGNRAAGVFVTNGASGSWIWYCTVANNGGWGIESMGAGYSSIYGDSLFNNRAGSVSIF